LATFSTTRTDSRNEVSRVLLVDVEPDEAVEMVRSFAIVSARSII